MARIAFIALLAMLAAMVPAAIAEDAVQAQPLITSHAIQIQLGPDASADVLEKYFFKFATSEDMKAFILDAEKNGPTLQAWTLYDNRFFPHFGNQEDISNTKISFDNKENALRLEYHLVRGIMDKADESSRQISWELSRASFNTYVKSGIVILPANTQVTVVLPPGATMESPPVPEAKIEGQEVTWKGYLTTNYMKLGYATGKPIAQPLDTGALVQAFFNSKQNLFIALIVALLVLLVYWKRKEIENRIENYIVEHSSLEHKGRIEEEVEIEAEK